MTRVRCLRPGGVGSAAGAVVKMFFDRTPTVFSAADTASTQCVDVNRPEGTARFVLEPRLHRLTSSRSRRSTTWRAMASNSKRARPGTLTTDRTRGGAAHAIMS
jgi:hypothetical protein